MYTFFNTCFSSKMMETNAGQTLESSIETSNSKSQWFAILTACFRPHTKSLDEYDFSEESPVLNARRLQAYSEIEKGLNEVEIFWKARDSDNQSNTSQIPSLNELKKVYDRFILNELFDKSVFPTLPNASKKTASIISLQNKDYCLLPLLIDEGGVKSIYIGIDIQTGKAVALSINPSYKNGKPCENYENGRLSQDVYNRLCQIGDKEGQGGVLPLKGMGDVVFYDTKNRKITAQVTAQMLCQQGDLFTLLNSNTALTAEQQKRIATDIYKGLSFLQANDLLHRDLKLENILIDGDRAYIADFDFTTLIESKEKQDIAGSTPYLAPEVRLGLRPYTKKADVWSLGLILYTLFTGNRPEIVTILNDKGRQSELDSVTSYENALPWNSDEWKTQNKDLLNKDNTGISLLTVTLCPLFSERCSLQESYELFEKIPADRLAFKHVNTQSFTI